MISIDRRTKLGRIGITLLEEIGIKKTDYDLKGKMKVEKFPEKNNIVFYLEKIIFGINENNPYYQKTSELLEEYLTKGQ